MSEIIREFLVSNVEIIIVSIIMFALIVSALVYSQQDIDNYYTRRGMK